MKARKIQDAYRRNHVKLIKSE